MRHKIQLINEETGYDSTLLIPEFLLPLFLKKARVFGGKTELFRFVANSDHPALKTPPYTRSGRVSYSPSGQNLQKINFRPRNEDWERFRLIAQGRRISMCFLFALVLLGWESFEQDGAGVPVSCKKLIILTTQTYGPAITRIHIHKIQI